MPGLVPGIHVFLAWANQNVDGRVKPGHDEGESRGIWSDSTTKNFSPAS